ncbi:hypothetical protein D9757_008332 [Collybiopsis confluens]|uniref:(2E,6E)-farnesyl diphosphate synthase n=1 Tax=Collybiopsis confluens TaxID=2823264 RepID=A0A8H5M5C3_9AGAR|nr:hypothetical protein D9757_008332 [Collybiopsis confluens]
MELLYSTKVDSSQFDSEGLCDGVELRKNNFTELEDRGALRARADWAKYVRPIPKYRGTLGPEYSFLSVCIPECIPERMEIVAYGNEIAFLYDDILDHEDSTPEDADFSGPLDAFLGGSRGAENLPNGSHTTSKEAGIKQVFLKLVTEMLILDRECALNSISILTRWTKSLMSLSKKPVVEGYTTLDQYLPPRMDLIGEPAVFALGTFGMGLKIPKNEVEKCRKLSRVAFFALILQNDLFSWDREYTAAQNSNQSSLENAVWVLMQEYKIDVQRAQQICRNRIKQYVSEYLQVVQKVKHDDTLSLDGRNKTCPRYHPEVFLNPKQLDWLRNGVPGTVGLPLSSPSSVIASSSPNVSSSISNRLSSSTHSAIPLIQNPHHAFEDVLLCTEIPEACSTEDVAEAPYRYINSLPSKRMREQFIDALNYWLKVPDDITDQIKAIINLLHQSTLMLDDIEDSSPLRRGHPAAHTIFGAPQVINSGGYCAIKAIEQIQLLGDSEIGTSSLLSLFKGQALDLHWTYHGICPSPAEYLKMIDSSSFHRIPFGNVPGLIEDVETGALFNLVTQLMLAHSPVTKKPDMSTLTKLFGRYYQIADDYKNLVSPDYTARKGFCEDFDEGKYSLPLIHLLQSAPDNLQLRNILNARRLAGKMMHEHKLLVLEDMKRAKSLEYTYCLLEKLHANLGQQLNRLEEFFEEPNAEVTIMWEILRV